MDLIEPLSPRPGKAWAEEAQSLRNRLDTSRGLAKLENLTAPHRPAAPLRSRLVPVIAAHRAALRKTAARLAGLLFA